MARKDIGRILSGGVILVGIVLACSLDAKGQAFKGQMLTFTISGSTGGLGGVVLKGLPGPVVVSDDSGYYTATVKYGWGGTVTPQKVGYTFEPTRRTYSKITDNQINEDYTPVLITYTVSGTTGIEGVVLNGLPGDTITGEGGAYSVEVDYGFTGTVVPTKEGYTFTPATKTYTQVNRDQANNNYTAARIKFTISGSADAGDVVMKGLPGNPVTGEGGAYSATVDYGWSGTITPTKEGHTFDPQSREYSDLISAQTNQNYTATVQTFTISGSANLAGVLMKGLPGDPITNEDGYYSASVDYGWSSAVTPTKEGYTFEPARRTYSKTTVDYNDQDYSSSVITLTISGTTSMGGVVIDGLPGNPVTEENGSYSVTVNYGFSGTVTPIKEGYTFDPPNMVYSSVSTNRTNQNYKALHITFVISGTAGIDNVVINGLPGKPVTDSYGGYSATVQFGWSGTVTPTKEGYTFDPPNREYIKVVSPQSDENYTSALLRLTISGTISSEGGPVEGVIVSAGLGEGTAMTDIDGQYHLSVDYGWRGVVAPAKEGYTFKPLNRTYTRVTRDLDVQGYTANIRMLTISGAVIIGGTPIEGVLVTANNGGGSDTTDAEGKYGISVPYGWSGEVAPTKEGYIFDPPSKSYTNVTTNIKDGEPELPPRAERRPIPAAEPARPEVPPVEAPGFPSRIEPEQPQVDQWRLLYEQELARHQRQMEELSRLSREPYVAPETGRLVPEQPLSVRTPGQQFIPRASQFEGPFVSAMYVDTDIREALQALSLQAGVDIYVDDTVKDKTVTCQFRQMPLGTALEIVLEDTGYIAKKIPHSYLVFAPVNNVFVESDMRQALQDIASQVGVVIVPDENVAGYVTCELKDVPLETALEIVLAGTGYSVTKTPYYYLVASSDPKGAAFPAVSETRRVEMNYLSANTAAGLLSSAFRAYVQAEVGTHTVVVTAPPNLVQRIVSDLKKLDKRPRHVMLDARVVVMERGDLLNLGVEWGWPTMRAGFFGSDHFDKGDTTTDFGGSSWPWGVQMGYSPSATFTDALELTLNLLAENGEADIVASPQVLAQDGKPAQIRVMTEEYFMMTAPEITGGFYARSELETITSGTSLAITPRIGDNDDITLELSIEVSDSIPRGRGSDLPVVTRRLATNTVRVQDGGTVALAGMTENRRRLKEKRVPGLSNLPFVGALFQSTESDQASKEVAVFVTARIVRDDVTPVNGAASTAPATTAPVYTAPAPTAPAYTAPAPTAPAYTAPTYTPSVPQVPTRPQQEGDFRRNLQDSLLRLR